VRWRVRGERGSDGCGERGQGCSGGPGESGAAADLRRGWGCGSTGGGRRRWPGGLGAAGRTDGG
jgi:hypothetical protein